MVAGDLYLGLISGTSADGVDAALVRFDPQLEVVAAQTIAYPDALRARVLALATGGATIRLDELGQLDVEVGAAFAASASLTLIKADMKPTAVAALGSHGQTLCHRPGGDWPFTLQIGDPSVIAERTGITTIADFRRADIAAGGQGAPLLPALHAAVFADARIGRVILNLGGIANITVLAGGDDVLGFDTGPANCLMDAWAARHLGTPRDGDGAWAATGQVNAVVLDGWLNDPYFTALPPKSSGREVFNLDWLDVRVPAAMEPVNVQRTLLELSARTIAAAIRAHGRGAREVFCCGGGVHNRALMDALRTQLPGLRVATTAALGLDPDYVEAVGFAWLARARLRGLPGNLPSVTGARGPRVLGAIYPAP